MKRRIGRVFCSVAILLAMSLIGCSSSADRVETANGVVEGLGRSAETGIRMFKGIPYAQPPVGDLRWKPAQPVTNWEGVLETKGFGPRCMQQPLFGDMGFRSNGMSEDCLYLNVWTPAEEANEGLPVLVYFYGGGLQAGDGSEPRYDGESMAAKGIVSVTVNYRLGIFGFFSHPELTQESPFGASGNYGFLDQVEALRWVSKNVAQFGGDPKRITIAGESAGSISVSALMVSPLSKDLLAGAIGESGALIEPTLPPRPRSETEAVGLAFGDENGGKSVADLRAMSAEELHDAAAKGNPFRFGPTVDGYFLPETPAALFAAGQQARIPLLAGWNSEEMNWRYLLREKPLTVENYVAAVNSLYGDRAAEALELYPASSEEEVLQSATDLAGDRFISYSTWKWIELHLQTGGQPTYRYYYARPRPPMRPEMGNATPGFAGGVVEESEAPAEKPQPPVGAVHSAEIEYAMGNLSTNEVYAWTEDDYEVSRVMQAYFANFVKTGDPNGEGLPAWPKIESADEAEFMRIDVESKAEPDIYRGRYLFLDQHYTK